MNAATRWVDGARAGRAENARRPQDRSWWAAGWAASIAEEAAGLDTRWRAERPPTDPRGDASPGRRGWRSGPLRPLSADWMTRHDERRRVVRLLRRAGYPARRAPVDLAAGVFARGSAVAGLRAADPWALARDLDQCGASWGVAIHENGAAAAPFSCNRRALCPVCAAAWAAKRAAAARAAIGPHVENGDAVALMTCTQRDIDGESLQAAAGRLRDGLRRLRRSRQWRRGVLGAIIGHEVTSRAGGRRWHPHAHVVVVGVPGIDPAVLRADLGRAWVRASEQAAAAAGRAGCGWAPRAGGCRVAKTGRVLSWSGGWFRPMDDLQAVKQACKYATPINEINEPAALFEFCAYQRGRRWAEGVGSLRGYMAEAVDEAEPEAEAAADALGPRLTQWGPGRAPSLGAVAPRWGLHEAPADDDGPPVALVPFRPTLATLSAPEVLGRLLELARRCDGVGSGLRLWIDPADIRLLLGASGRAAVGREATQPPPGGWEAHGLPTA